MKTMPVSVEIYGLPSIYMREKDLRGKAHATQMFDEFFAMLHRYGIRHITTFPWACEKYGFYNKYTPFKGERAYGFPQGYLYDVLTWNDQWFEEFREFLAFPKKHHIKTRLIGWNKYSARPFEPGWNENNITGMASTLGKRYFLKAWKKTMRNVRRVYWNSLNLPIRLSNETPYRGINTLKMHTSLYETVKRYLGPRGIEKVFCDISHSEFARIQEEELHIAPGWFVSKHEYYVDYTEEERHAHPIINVYGNDIYNRKAWLEFHDMHLEHAMRETDEVATSAWKKIVWNLDGNSVGSGYEVPGTDFVGLDHDELREWARAGFAEKRVEVWLAYFPMDIFVIDKETGELIEDLSKFPEFDLQIIKEEWERANG